MKEFTPKFKLFALEHINSINRILNIQNRICFTIDFNDLMGRLDIKGVISTSLSGLCLMMPNLISSGVPELEEIGSAIEGVLDDPGENGITVGSILEEMGKSIAGCIFDTWDEEFPGENSMMDVL